LIFLKKLFGRLCVSTLVSYMNDNRDSFVIETRAAISAKRKHLLNPKLFCL
jgi:hypothetical protein